MATWTQSHIRHCPSQSLYTVAVLAGHKEMAVLSGFWEGISFYDKWKRHSYDSHLSPYPPSSCLKWGMWFSSHFEATQQRPSKMQRWALISFSTRSSFYILRTIEIWGQITLCCRGLYCSLLNTEWHTWPFCPLDARWQSKICLPGTCCIAQGIVLNIL